MTERVTVLLTREQADFVRRLAERARRPKAFVIRELVERAQQQDREAA
jgi:predicted DNA-binding protein